MTEKNGNLIVHTHTHPPRLIESGEMLKLKNHDRLRVLLTVQVVKTHHTVCVVHSFGSSSVIDWICPLPNFSSVPWTTFNCQPSLTHSHTNFILQFSRRFCGVSPWRRGFPGNISPLLTPSVGSSLFFACSWWRNLFNYGSFHKELDQAAHAQNNAISFQVVHCTCRVWVGG